MPAAPMTARVCAVLEPGLLLPSAEALPLSKIIF